MNSPLPPLAPEGLLVFLAGSLIGNVIRHPEAPEGIELFEWHWFPYDERNLPEVVFMRPQEGNPAWLVVEEVIEPHPVSIETDSVRPSGPGGAVVVADPSRLDGVVSLPWLIGWNRLARKGVLWFAGGQRGTWPK